MRRRVRGLAGAGVGAGIALLLATMVLPTTAAAQVPAIPERSEPIRDNSFLIEEGFNQDPGMVQHIATFDRAEGGAWAASFTQEWPLGGMKHQLGFTLPLVRSAPGETGIGDIALNYRFQLAGTAREDDAAFVAPRLTLLLPTGAEAAGRGNGGVGVQAGLPISLVMARSIVVHLNAGLTLVPDARNAAGDAAGTWGAALGGSIVWLPHPKLNFLVESLWERETFVVGPDTTAAGKRFVLNPGVRLALDAGGLQIVPGAAYTIGIGPSKGEEALFLYLSLEHPFR